jgi:thiol:disulfide interchange protein DsbD
MILRLLLITLFFSLATSTQSKPLDQLLKEDAEQTSASGLEGNSGDDSDTVDLLAIEEEEFLPVEEAYQLSVSRSNDGLSLDWIIADKYYLYGEQFRFLINQEEIQANKPAGIINYDPIFEKDVEKHYHRIEITIDKNLLPQGKPFELSAISQGCADAGLCYPPQTQNFRVDADKITPIVAAGFTGSSSNSSPNTLLAGSTSLQGNNEASALKVLTMLLFAIAGGMILNLMPCVLPVLSLKALALASSNEDHKAQGWSYTIGVISTFLLIAGILLAVRTAGQMVGWGFQLQSPSFVTLLIYLFFVMGLSLSGFITIGTRWMSAGQSLTQGSGLKQSYFTGVLAAVVASPCTAPFMAPALGFAITQPWWIALSIFASLGLGMALPLLLLSYLPHLEKLIPKPGPWMETFKQALAFPLYLTALWLLWVLGRQLGNDAAALVLLGALALVFFYWLSLHLKVVQSTTGLAAFIIAIGMCWHISQRPPIEVVKEDVVWESYNTQRVAELRQQNKSIFINMTADWCITCLANEKLVFTDSMIELMKNKQIHLFKGDWTNYDPEITQTLEKYGRSGVPLYLLIPPGGEAQILPQILSPSGFKSKIDGISRKLAAN